MTDNQEMASITPNFDASTDWILLGVQRGGDALVLDADEGFRQRDLLPELWACDNLIDLPPDLKPGLYRLTDIVIKPDSYGDPTFKGTLTALHIHAPAKGIEAAQADKTRSGLAAGESPVRDSAFAHTQSESH